MRPNLHIQDYCDVIKLLMVVEASKVNNEIFNVGFQNLTILQIAELVKRVVEQEFPGPQISIQTSHSDDTRSYHINSDKIRTSLGFEPKYNIEHAVWEICDAFRNDLYTDTLNDDQYFNVKRLKKIQAK
jgi:nucleoside-diphosphate-sugar epimerase